jgi:hypothetical protein
MVSTFVSFCLLGNACVAGDGVTDGDDNGIVGVVEAGAVVVVLSAGHDGALIDQNTRRQLTDRCRFRDCHKKEY